MHYYGGTFGQWNDVLYILLQLKNEYAFALVTSIGSIHNSWLDFIAQWEADKYS